MADRISLRKARSGHVPTPEPTRADDAPTTPHGGVLSSGDQFAAPFGERPSEQLIHTFTTVYDPLTGEQRIVPAGEVPPPPPAPPLRVEGQRPRSFHAAPPTNSVTVNSQSLSPLSPSVLRRISSQVARAFRRDRGEQTTIEPEDVPAPPPMHHGGTVTGRMSGPPMPNLSSIPRAVRVGPSLEEQGVGFARAETITVQSWDDIRTREHVYSLRLNGATPDTRVTYEAMEMIGDNEEDKARYWSRAIASQLVRNLEADVAERLYELLRNNGRMG